MGSSDWFVVFLVVFIVTICSMGWIMSMLRAVWDRFAKHFPRFSHYVAGWGWAGLVVAAFGLEEGHEYCVALLLVVAAAGSLVATCIHWQGLPDDLRLTKIIRVSGVVLAILIVTIGFLWIWGNKGDQPCSRLPEAYRIVFHKHKGQPLDTVNPLSSFQKYAATATTFVESDNRDNQQVIAVYGEKLYTPIPVLVYMRITNLQSVAAQVVGVSFELHAKGTQDVAKTVIVPTADVYGQGEDHIFKQNRPNRILLEELRRPIPPRQAAEGWVFLDVDKRYDFLPHPLLYTVTIKDSFGNADSLELESVNVDFESKSLLVVSVLGHIPSDWRLRHYIEYDPWHSGDGLTAKTGTPPVKPRLPQKPLPAYQETPYSKWSNDALRKYTLSFADRLRDYEQIGMSRQAAMRQRHQQNSMAHQSDPREQQDSLWRSQVQDDEELREDYDNGYRRDLFPIAENLRDELCTRLGVSPAVQQPSALQFGGSTAGAYPLRELALYLQRLAQHLAD